MKNILLCDSQRATRDFLKSALETYGFYVKSQENSTRVLAELKHSKYDLLLCDYLVQPLSGFELCESIRKAQERRIREINIFILGYGSLRLEDHKFLRQNSVMVIPKFKSPEKYFEKINLINDALI